MNNQILKYLAVFGAGITVGFFVTKKTLEQKYAEIAQEEIDSVKNVFSRKTEVSEIDEEEKEYYNDRMVSSLNGTKTNEYNNVKNLYNIIPSRDRTMREPGEDDEMAASYDDYDERDMTPQIISEEDFSNDFLHHEKITLTYYAADNTLCDDNEDIVDDIDYLIGYENLDMKNASLTNPHVIYIRNEKIGSDYEVLIDLNSYHEVVLGFEMGKPATSPRERYEKKRRVKDDDNE